MVSARAAAVKAMLPCCSPSLQFSSRPSLHFPSPSPPNPPTISKFKLCSPCSSSPKPNTHTVDAGKREYKPGLLDDVLLNFFRTKMVQEVGWDSEKPGYDGLIEVANCLMKGKSNQETQLSAMLVAPIADGKVASMMVARATALSCKWLMGPCSVNSVVLPDGNSCSSGVFVEKCRYLEESKCIGICISTCKIPTQTFFKDYMGVELYMEPNFEDYSCQFNFGVPAVSPAVDKALKEPCLEICTNANRRRELGRRESDIAQCPQL